MTRQAALAQTLHNARCVGYADGYCNGGDHLTTFRALAGRLLAADDPAVELHARFCDADLDPNTNCPDVEGHVNWMRQWLANQAPEASWVCDGCARTIPGIQAAFSALDVGIVCGACDAAARHEEVPW